MAEAQHVRGFALHVRNGFEAATHRFGHVGAAKEAKSHDRALFRGPYDAKLRQTEIQEVQLHQQRRVTAEFDIDAHDVLEHGNACDFNACADQSDRNRKHDAEHGNEQRHHRTVDEEWRVVRHECPVEHAPPIFLLRLSNSLRIRRNLSGYFQAFAVDAPHRTAQQPRNRPRRYRFFI